MAAFHALRDRQLSAPYLNGHRESTLSGLMAELVRELFLHEPTAEETGRLVSLRCKTFLDCVQPVEGVQALLSRLRTRFRLALVSNYPCGKCIRDSLHEVGYAKLFESVVVSGDVGLCKPHPKPFEQALSELGLSPTQCVYVGDNWLCDVQGAKRIGMRAILTTEYTPYQRITPEPNDYEPDARITKIGELETLLT
jgi:FMN phosphatase YigB (HAD superfamily)